MLLHIEIDQNLAALKEYEDKAIAVFPLEDKGSTALPLEDYGRFAAMRKCYHENIPQWRHQRWESLTPLLAATLKEQEIKEVDDFHASLEALTGRLSKLQSSDPAAIMQAIPPEHRKDILVKATERAFIEWQAYRWVIENLLRARRPLEGQAHTNAKTKLLARFRRKGNMARQDARETG